MAICHDIYVETKQPAELNERTVVLNVFMTQLAFYGHPFTVVNFYWS